MGRYKYRYQVHFSKILLLKGESEKCTVLIKHNHTHFFIPKTYRIDEILTIVRNQPFNVLFFRL